MVSRLSKVQKYNCPVIKLYTVSRIAGSRALKKCAI